MKNILIVTTFIFLSMGFADAQDDNVWNLERCINYAIENNIDIKRQELQMVLSEKDFNQTRFNLLPNLGGVVEHQLSSGRSLAEVSMERSMAARS